MYLYLHHIYILDSQMAPSGARIVAQHTTCMRTIGSMGLLVSTRLNATWLEFNVCMLCGPSSMDKCYVVRSQVMNAMWLAFNG